MERILLLVLLSLGMASALDNGLALTPPMGWLSWERFRCETDCKKFPDSCISEKLYMDMADKMVELGFRELGYVYVNIDDCWLAKERDNKTGKLVPDPERFPHGMKYLSDYMHQRGLKFGIYEDFGSTTCAGYPGSEFFLELDAKTFAEWDVDMVKFDGCNSDPKDMPYGYPAMGYYLNATGRPFLFSCSWPAYITGEGQEPNYPDIKEHCNIWRNYKDMQDGWQKVTQIIDYWGKDVGKFTQVAGPGGFNDPDMAPDYKLIRKTCNMWRNYWDVTDSWDSVSGIINYYGNHVPTDYTGPGGWFDPDMLVVGDFGLSYSQQRAQFGMWAMFAAPLFMSVDLRTIKPEAVAILQNKEVIAINQDPLGAQGAMIYGVSNSVSVWLKPLSQNRTAIAVLNQDNQGRGTPFSFALGGLGLTNPGGYNITELFDGKQMGVFKPTTSIDLVVDPTSIILLKIVPVPAFKTRKDKILIWQ